MHLPASLKTGQWGLVFSAHLDCQQWWLKGTTEILILFIKESLFHHCFFTCYRENQGKSKLTRMPAAVKTIVVFPWEGCLMLQISHTFILVESICGRMSRAIFNIKKHWKCNRLVGKLISLCFKAWFTGRAVMSDMFSVKIAYTQCNSFIS